jgi:UDP-N-acetylenolpyruvoylglucosamine reductase
MESDSIYRGLLKQISQVETSYSLQEFTPLKTGGVCDYFTRAKDTVELATAVKAALDVKIPYIVVGQCRSALFSDGGFPGLVIHNQSSSFMVASDRSQVVVDSGLSLDALITRAASLSLGGLTHLYGLGGTVGGAIYSATGASVRSILSSVTYLTMLMPPAKLDREATIVRYRADWLEVEEGVTRLQRQKSAKQIGDSGPILLTALLQLTSVRPDELQLRLQNQAKTAVDGLGPLFEEVSHADVSKLLRDAGVASLRSGEIYPNRYNPNYLTGSGKGSRAQDIRLLIDQMQARVAEVYGVQLVPRYEYLGVW